MKKTNSNQQQQNVEAARQDPKCRIDRQVQINPILQPKAIYLRLKTAGSSKANSVCIKIIPEMVLRENPKNKGISSRDFSVSTICIDFSLAANLHHNHASYKLLLLYYITTHANPLYYFTWHKSIEVVNLSTLVSMQQQRKYTPTRDEIQKKFRRCFQSSSQVISGNPQHRLRGRLTHSPQVPQLNLPYRNLIRW